jgi:hypothetical protein
VRPHTVAAAGIDQENLRPASGSAAETVEIDPERPEFVAARRILNQAGVRKFPLDGELVIGVWADLDGPEIRAALKTIQSDVYPVRYLDGPGTPEEYKGRQVAGEPLPMNVLHAVMENPTAPWEVRDQMLAEMKWCPDGTPWEKWKAQARIEVAREDAVAPKSVRVLPEPAKPESPSVSRARLPKPVAPDSELRLLWDGPDEDSEIQPDEYSELQRGDQNRRRRSALP